MDVCRVPHFFGDGITGAYTAGLGAIGSNPPNRDVHLGQGTHIAGTCLLSVNRRSDESDVEAGGEGRAVLGCREGEKTESATRQRFDGKRFEMAAVINDFEHNTSG